MSIEEEEEKFMEELAKRSQILLEDLDKKDAIKIQNKIDETIENRQELVQSYCLHSKKYLDLGSCEIDDFDSITLGIYLNELHSNLEVINLASNKLTDEGLLNMLIGVQFHSNLRELYLGNNQFSIGTAIEGLSAIIPCLKNLRILGLGGLNIDDDDLVKICYGVSELTSLKNLQLHNNKISDEGLICLISMMLLGFGQNSDITEEGVIKLFECLQFNSTLKCLHLNDLIMTDKSLLAINICLMSNQCLEELNLGNCGIDDEGFKVLGDCIKNNTKLQYLHLWNNYLTFESAELIQEILENYNSTLKGITLYNNDIINKDLLNDIEQLTQQNVYFVQTVNNEELYEKKISEMKKKLAKDIQQKKEEQKETLLQGKVKGFKNTQNLQPSNTINQSSLSQSITSTQQQQQASSKLNSSSSNKFTTTTTTTAKSSIAKQQTPAENNGTTKRPSSGVASQKPPTTSSTIRNSAIKDTKTPSITSSKTSINTVSKIPSKSGQTPLKIDQKSLTQQKGSSKVINKTNSIDTKNKNNLQTKSKQLKSQQNESEDDEDLEYVSLSTNINGQVVKRDAYIDEDIQSDNDIENKQELKAQSRNEQMSKQSNKNNDSNKVEKENSQQLGKQQQQSEDDEQFEEEWLDDDEEDERELQILEKQLEQDEEIISKEKNSTRLEYIDEFYNEEESNKQAKKYKKFEQNLTYDPNDPNTLKWKGFFEDKNTGLLKSKLE